MTLLFRLASLLLSRKEHARFVQNGTWLEGALECFSTKEFPDLPSISRRPTVLMYGSSIAGTAFRGGDADYAVVFPFSLSSSDSLCKMCPRTHPSFCEVKRDQHRIFLLSILDHIRKTDNSGLLGCELICSARVPVVRIARQLRETSEVINFDVSLSLDGLRNSLLLRLYMELDPRLRAGVLCAKSWGRSQNILNARRGWISPYALTVMYIYFMQVSKRTNSIIDEDTVNDILCDTARVAAGDVGVVHPRCYNILPLRAVNLKDVLNDVRDFFIFFGGSGQFDFDKDVVDIRTRNKIVSKEQWLGEVQHLDSQSRWERLGYEAIMFRDPYEDHNLGRSVDFFRAENIRETFRLASIKDIEDAIFRQ
uniref:RNA uridylyltransferase n=1 Tax=Trypanosoma vivax (strain Y486) TaxID=1055687 RepID=G0U507_TRYVY|nr:conserved hypothetical protein [Trypanosoma vivax Y486]